VTLRETIEGKAFLKVFGKSLSSREELSLVVGQKLLGFVTGIIKARSVEDTMQGFPNFIMLLLGHPRPNIPNTMDGTAMPGDFSPEVIYRFKEPLVTLGINKSWLF